MCLVSSHHLNTTVLVFSCLSREPLLSDSTGDMAPALPLWDVEHVLGVGPVQRSSVHRPQSAEDPEQRTLPTAVWTCYQHIHALIHLAHTHTQREGKNHFTTWFKKRAKERWTVS